VLFSRSRLTLPASVVGVSSNVRPHRKSTLASRALFKLLVGTVAGLPLQTSAQPTIPNSSLYSPKPSQDLSWAHGSWAAKEEHPVQGQIVAWRVTISPNGRYAAELVRTAGAQPSLEIGVWVVVDREIWSFTATERDRKPIAPEALAPELYTVLVISPQALELRHMGNGKVLRLVRGSV
jgi:hypothetical protein